jgi:uncharacterized membrane protein YtjA (UPF0391 family)
MDDMVGAAEQRRHFPRSAVAVGAVLRGRAAPPDASTANRPIAAAAGARHTGFVAAMPTRTRCTTPRLAARPRSTWKELAMLHYAVVFFVIALIAALLGFSGLAASAAGIAKILFVVFAIMAVATFLFGLVRKS